MTSDPVILALSEQVGCYRRLAKLAEIQHDFVQNGQTEQLIQLLESRQRLIDQISALDRNIAPAKQRWTDYLKTLEAADRSQAETMMTETRDLLARITAADKDDVMVLQQRKLNMGRQLQQTMNARQVNRSYVASAYGRAVPRMDVKQ